MGLVDSHCHLQADRFDDDVDEVVASAREAGVERILVPGWNAWSSAAALALVSRDPELDAAVGVHPHDADKATDEEWAEIARSAHDPGVVAIGETGLDYDRVFSPILAQLANLRRNLALAAETGKPVILHCRSSEGEREAQDALLAEVRAFAGAIRPVIHSFSGPLDYADAMLQLGAVISISGLAFRSGEEATASVDAPRRRQIMRHHSATHLLHRALREILGDQVVQKGSWVGPDHTTFDIPLNRAITKPELERVNKRVMEKVRAALPFHESQKAYKEAVAQGAREFCDFAGRFALSHQCS